MIRRIHGLLIVGCGVLGRNGIVWVKGMREREREQRGAAESIECNETATSQNGQKRR